MNIQLSQYLLLKRIILVLLSKVSWSYVNFYFGLSILFHRSLSLPYASTIWSWLWSLLYGFRLINVSSLTLFFFKFVLATWVPCISTWILGLACQFMWKNKLKLWQRLYWIYRSIWKILLSLQCWISQTMKFILKYYILLNIFVNGIIFLGLFFLVFWIFQCYSI